MSQLTLQEVFLQTEDVVGSYSTGIATDDKKIRAIMRSIEYLKRRLSFPSDEVIFKFLYSQDQFFIDLPEDFNESLFIKYLDEAFNKPSYEWQYSVYPEVLRQAGNSPDFMYSITNINGRKQLVMLGHNIRQGQTLDALNTVGSWFAGGDASNLRLDQYKAYTGNASLAFDINYSAGVAYIENDSIHWNLKDLFSNSGFIKVWAFLTNSNLTDVAIKLYTTPSNYCTILAETADDGSEFSEDEWIKVGVNVDDAVVTGTAFDPTNITRIRIEFDLPAGFGNETDFHLNVLFDTFPDEMKLIYSSAYKGTDETGVTQKFNLTEMSDLLSIGADYPDFIGLIAGRAGIELWPQLKGDKTAYALVLAKFNDDMKTWGRVFPRKRTQISTFGTKLRR